MKDNFLLSCRKASALAPSCVGWSETKWVVYDPKDPPTKVEPELFFYKRGKPPIPLSDLGMDAWNSLINSLILDSNYVL